MNPETIWDGINVATSLDVHVLPQGTAFELDNSELCHQVVGQATGTTISLDV